MANERKKLSLADLITKKIEKDKKRANVKQFYVKSLEGEITLQLPPEEVIFEAMDKIKDETFVSIMSAYVLLIYNSIELFRNPELHNELGIVDPYDVVSQLLDLEERLAIGEKIMEMSGLNKIDTVAKN